MTKLIIRASGSAGGSGNTSPSWVTSLAQFPTWTKIAKGSGTGFDSGAMLGQIIQSPNSANPAASWGSRHGIMDGYTGACLDPFNQELLIVASGGHDDGANNSGFALSLGDEIPKWRRLTDCTPDSQIADPTPDAGGQTFLDGRPRAMHASNMVWAGTSTTDSKVWFPMMSSTTSGGGGHISKIVSFDRGSLGAATTPLAWTGANLGPWAFPGNATDAANTGFGGAVFDAANNKIINIGNGQNSFGIFWTKFTPGTSVTDTESTDGVHYFDVSSVPVICPDLGIVVICGGNDATLGVLDIAANTWAKPTMSGTTYFNHTAGAYTAMVYIKENHSILIMDPHQTGNTAYKVAIPMSGANYNPAGTWVWTSITMSGGPQSTDYPRPTASNWPSGKLVKHTYPDGKAVVVLPTSVDGPTFIAKVPAAGI